MKTYGLLGRNIGYSFSRNYFSKKFENEHIKAQYQNFDIPDIENAPKILSSSNVDGLNVTIPYKEVIIPYLDNLDPIAKEIGAVNVIKIRANRETIGYNSDFYGFTESLKPLLHDEITSALILGTGGASKAIAYALQRLEIHYIFVSRNPGKNEVSYSAINENSIKNNKLIINCTPLGTHPNIHNFPDIPYQYLTDAHILYDLIYNPEVTTFMKKGLDQGATIKNGLQMLIGQAEKSWEIWNT